MWDAVAYVFGEATGKEVALGGVFVAVILLYSWSPAIGEAIGAMFEGDDDPAA